MIIKEKRGGGMSGSNIATILRVVMDAEEITETMLQQLSGVQQSTINRILNATSKAPKESTLSRLGAPFGLTSRQLKGEDPLPAKYPYKTAGKESGSLHHLPIVTMKALARAMIDDGGLLNLRDRAKGTIQSPIAISKEAFCVLQDNDSMFPAYNKEEILFVEPGLPLVNDCDILVYENGAIKFRRYTRCSEGSFLKTANKRWPDSISIMPPDAKIVGVIFYSGMWRYFAGTTTPLEHDA
jgi:hypothetical protein